jgi:hypothetical protein
MSHELQIPWLSPSAVPGRKPCRSRRGALAAVAVLAVCANPLSAQVLVLTPDQAVSGERLHIEKGEIQLFPQEGSKSSLKFADALWIGFDARPCEMPRRSWLSLQDGQRLAGQSLDIVPGKFVLKRADGGEIAAAVEDTAAVVFASFRPDIASPPESGVRIISTNGDALDAPAVELTPGGAVVDINPAVDPLLIPRDRLAGLVWAESSGSDAAGKAGGASVQVELRDGERWTGTIRSLDGQGLTLSTGDGERKVPGRELRTISQAGTRIVVLDAVVEAPEAEGRPPYRIGRNALGGPLRLGGRFFARGIGGRAPLELNVAIPENAVWFTGAAGVDADAAAFGRVSFEFLVDGKPAREQKDARPDEAPRAVTIPVKGARTLTIRMSAPTGDSTGSLGDIVDALFILDQ